MYNDVIKQNNMSLTLGEVKENAEYNLKKLSDVPFAKLIGEIQL